MTTTQLAPQPVLSFDHREERVLFLGTPQVAVPTLRALADSPLRPMAVITEADKPVGRKHVLTPPPIKRAAQELGIPVSQPTTADELQAVVASLRPTIGVVVAYGRILTKELLELADHGFVNLHFSLLPKYRGATPLQAAILNGDTETGVTLMQIDEGLDTGPIVGWTTEAISPTETTGSLGERLAEVGALLATELLPNYMAGQIVAAPQEATDERVTRRLTKESGRIDWNQDVVTIERFIRAMNPWPRAWIELSSERVIIHAAHLDGDTLILDRLQVAGSTIISAAQFGRGYPKLVSSLLDQHAKISFAK